MRRLTGLVLALSLALLAPSPTLAAPAGPPETVAPGPPETAPPPTRVYPTREGKAAAGNTSTSNLASRGGSIQTTPSVAISWWGPEWQTGFTKDTYTSSQAQQYSRDFFTNVGGSSWINSTTQYCQGVASGTTTCPAASSTVLHVTNPVGQLKAEWTDTTAVPPRPSQTDIAKAAVRLAQQVGYDANRTYFVYTPSGKSQSGFGVRWCAWHSSTTDALGRKVAYAYMPYQPDAGASCGVNFVNKTNDSYGHGYFDGFSIVGGHEYAEAQTDPFPNSGWLDSSGAENADKCAWNSSTTAISLGIQTYAVQPLWSNGSSGCAMSY